LLIFGAYTGRLHRVRSWWCNVGCSVSAAAWCVERAVEVGGGVVAGGLGTGCRFGLGVCRPDKLESTAGALDTLVTRHWLEYLPKQQ
jgi:hypothetical protein